MESAAVPRFFAGTMQVGHPELCHRLRPVVAKVFRETDPISRFLMAPQAVKSLSIKRRALVQPYASESSAAVTSHGNTSQGTLKNNHNKSTFPTGFEELVLDVCDETNIAEITMKVGDFEMHLKRSIASTTASLSTLPPILSPSTAPPIPSMPMSDSCPDAPQPASPPPAATPSKTSSGTGTPFAYVSSLKESKLAALKASGLSGYTLVSSPTVGSFRSGRTVKGKKQPPNCKEGIVIKEGDVIGYLDQFGNELPIKSNVEGEVLKILFKDGEPVGYGDPLIAVLPYFHGIE